MTQLTSSLTAFRTTLLHQTSQALILGDSHVGKSAALNAQGVLVPQTGFKDLYKNTHSALEAINPNRIVLNGDVKHNFGKITDDEWDKVFTYIDLLKQYAEVIVIRGNHDVLLDPLAEKSNVDIEDHFVLDNTYVCHGHEIHNSNEFKDASTIVIGHEHPAIGLERSGRVEHYKAFQKTQYKDKELIVMPSMHTFSEGSDVLREKTLSPYLNRDQLNKAEAYIVGEEDEPLPFGNIVELKRAI